MARLEWEKARAADRQRAAYQPPVEAIKRRAAARQDALAAFASKHRLSCFSCKTASAEWAMSGISKRGPWIICVPCVQKRPAARPQQPIAEA